MTDVWSERAEQYRTSDAHREGPDLDLLVEWARGRAHGARRRHRRRARRAPAPRGGDRGRQLRPGSRDAARRRLPRRAPPLRRRQLRRRRNPGRRAPFRRRRAGGRARWPGSRRAAVLIVDNVFMGDDVEEAERLRDPSHVRNYSEAEWRAFSEAAGLRVEEVRFFEKPIELQPWLDRCGCAGEDAVQRRRAPRRPRRRRLT